METRSLTAEIISEHSGIPINEVLRFTASDAWFNAPTAIAWGLADKLPDCRMPIPVRFLLDNFATNTIIPNFDGIISVIRLREISVSLIVQSFSQLESLYGKIRRKDHQNKLRSLAFLRLAGLRNICGNRAAV